MTRLALLCALAALLAAPALAHDDDAQPSGQTAAPGDPGPCKQDGEKLCPGMHPGDGKFGPCMKEHKDDVSDACRDKMKAMHGKMKERTREKADACKDEAAKVCPDMKPGDGKFGPCMKEHKDELSAGCKRMIGRMMMAKGKKHQGGDAKKGDGDPDGDGD